MFKIVQIQSKCRQVVDPYPAVWTGVALFFRESGARSACTYELSDLAVHSPLICHKFLLPKSHMAPSKLIRSVCVNANNLNTAGQGQNGRNDGFVFEGQA